MHAITIPDNLYRLLEQEARVTQRSVDDIVQQTLIRHLPVAPEIAQIAIEVEDDLPPVLQLELQAMAQLSDTALWSLAQSTMLAEQRAELAGLNEEAKTRSLNHAEKERQAFLLRGYEETILRRAHAALLLQARGYDVQNTVVLLNQ
jgi:hypothetical protein